MVGQVVNPRNPEASEVYMRATRVKATRVRLTRDPGGLAPGAAREAELAKPAFPQAAENDRVAVENRGLAGLAARPLVRASVTRHPDGRYLLALYPLDREGARIAGLGVAGIYSSLGGAMAAAYGHAWQSGAALQGIGVGSVCSGA